jgi:hypothetical protein
VGTPLISASGTSKSLPMKRSANHKTSIKNGGCFKAAAVY